MIRFDYSTQLFAISLFRKCDYKRPCQIASNQRELFKALVSHGQIWDAGPLCF